MSEGLLFQRESRTESQQLNLIKAEKTHLSLGAWKATDIFLVESLYSNCNFLHFPEEETDAQRGQATAEARKSCREGEVQSWCLTASFFDNIKIRHLAPTVYQASYWELEMWREEEPSTYCWMLLKAFIECLLFVGYFTKEISQSSLRIDNCAKWTCFLAYSSDNENCMLILLFTHTA